MGMSSLVAAVRSQVFRLLAQRYPSDGPFSLLPDKLLLPLLRDGLDPVCRDREPVTRLSVPFGIRAWLVTGYEPAREVLSSLDGYSNDFGKLAGRVGMKVTRDPGGLGFADPPVHTRLRKALTPEFTMRRLARLQPRIEAIVAGQLDVLARAPAKDLWRACWA